MHKVRLIPVNQGEDAYDLALLEYRLEQLERWREWLANQPTRQMERKEAQAVISNTTIQWLVLVLLIVSTATQLFSMLTR